MGSACVMSGKDSQALTNQLRTGSRMLVDIIMSDRVFGEREISTDGFADAISEASSKSGGR
jgi:hypothetical protein